MWPPPPFDNAWVYFLLTLVLAVIGVLYWLFPSHGLGVTVIALFSLLSLWTIIFGFWATSRL